MNNGTGSFAIDGDHDETFDSIMVWKGEAGLNRVLACLVDHLLIVSMVFLLTKILSGLSFISIIALFFTVLALYFIILEGIWSRSVGKALFGLMVIRIDGGVCGWREATVRNLVRLVETNPLVLAIPCMIAIRNSNRRQRTGDSLAGTMVIATRLLEQ